MKTIVQPFVTNRSDDARLLERVIGLCAETVDVRVMTAHRVLAGSCLAGYCAEQARTTSAVMGWLGAALPLNAGHSGFGALLSEWVSRPNAAAFWYSSCALAVLLALGIWPRLTALLLSCGLIAATRVLNPVLQFDDIIAAATSVWLCLLPIDAGSRARARAPGDLVPRLYLASVGLIYCNLGFWSRYWLGWSEGWPVRTLLCLVPALMLLPTGHRIRWFAAAAQLGVHFWLTLHARFSYSAWLLAASSLLFLRKELSLALGPRPPQPGAPALDLRAAGALAYACAVLLFIVSGALAVPASANAAATLLGDVGAAPELFVFGRVAPFRSSSIAERDLSPDVARLPEGARKRLLLSQLTDRPWRALPNQQRDALRSRLTGKNR